MIKFFRKIRHTMLKENKFSKYLLYAVGEIVLVVIGILIALSINNWNESLKSEQREIDIAKELYFELNENLVYTKAQKENWEKRANTAQLLSDLIVTEKEIFTQREFDSTMLYILGYYKLNLIKNKFDNIVSSETFEFKRSRTLQREMLALKGLYETLEEYYHSNVEVNNKVLRPYLNTIYSFRNFNNVFSNETRDFDVNHKRLLNDIKFDNAIQNVIGSSMPFVRYFDVTIKKMEALKKQLEDTYPDITNE
jgi:hypothetical protein